MASLTTTFTRKTYRDIQLIRGFRSPFRNRLRNLGRATERNQGRNRKILSFAMAKPSETARNHLGAYDRNHRNRCLEDTGSVSVVSAGGRWAAYVTGQEGPRREDSIASVFSSWPVCQNPSHETNRYKGTAP
jgi:hypothetical protein